MGWTLANARVLIVEDSWLIAELVASALRDEGARVIGPAISLADALRLCGRTSPDMAVVDLNLNGEMAYPLLRQLGERRIPTVVITGHGYGADVPQTLSAIIGKPFAADQLVRALGKACTGDRVTGSRLRA